MSEQTNDKTKNTSVSKEDIYDIIKNAPTFAYIDEIETAKKGRDICKKYARYIESMKQSKLSKETGCISQGSIIKTPEKNCSPKGDRMLRRIIKEEDNPSHEFFAMLDIIGKINKDYRTYLYLTYCENMKHSEVCLAWRKKSREVSTIQLYAHVLIAHLTKNTVMRKNEELKK